MKILGRSSHVARGRARSQNGSSLIEALVAVMIFSFGVLGLAGLQGVMLRNQTDAKYRTDAAFMANEVMGLAWTDRANLTLYGTTPTAVCGHPKCADWVAKVGRGLPGGKATVLYTASSGDFVVTVAWTMPDGAHQYVTNAIIPVWAP